MRRLLLFLGIGLGVVLLLAEHRRSGNRSSSTAPVSPHSPSATAADGAAVGPSPQESFPNGAGRESGSRAPDPELINLPRQALFEIGRDLGIDLRDLIVMRSDQLIGAISEAGTRRPSVRVR
jgi:hypothetical protein